jgi:glycosyltransferase involved in cell wall biosynthesis
MQQPVRAVIVGTGPLEEELRASAESLGITALVTFTGMRTDVDELLPAFDVFVLSSRFEGLPIALLEAMGAGLPSVVTAVGGIPEVVDDGIEGILVPAGDLGAFTSALEKLLGDPELRRAMGRAAEVRASRLDLANAVHLTEQIYDRVLRRGA